MNTPLKLSLLALLIQLGLSDELRFKFSCTPSGEHGMVLQFDNYFQRGSTHLPLGSMNTAPVYLDKSQTLIDVFVNPVEGYEVKQGTLNLDNNNEFIIKLDHFVHLDG